MDTDFSYVTRWDVLLAGLTSFNLTVRSLMCTLVGGELLAKGLPTVLVPVVFGEVYESSVCGVSFRDVMLQSVFQFVDLRRS